MGFGDFERFFRDFQDREQDHTISGRTVSGVGNFGKRSESAYPDLFSVSYMWVRSALLLFTIACTATPEDTRALQEKLVAEMLLDFSRILSHSEKAYILSEEASYSEKIETFRLEIQSQNALNLVESRLLIVNVTKKLLDTIDKNRFIRSELRQSPFPVERLRISIAAAHKNHEPICSIILENGLVRYFSYEPTEKSFRYYYEEDFKDAIDILSQSNDRLVF